jgi:hypothetical protein
LAGFPSRTDVSSPTLPPVLKARDSSNTRASSRLAASGLGVGMAPGAAPPRPGRGTAGPATAGASFTSTFSPLPVSPPGGRSKSE